MEAAAAWTASPPFRVPSHDFLFQLNSSIGIASSSHSCGRLLLVAKSLPLRREKKTAIKGNIGLTSHGLAFSSRGQSVRGGGREHERDDEEERERRYHRHRRRERDVMAAPLVEQTR